MIYFRSWSRWKKPGDPRWFAVEETGGKPWLVCSAIHSCFLGGAVVVYKIVCIYINTYNTHTHHTYIYIYVCVASIHPSIHLSIHPASQPSIHPSVGRWRYDIKCGLTILTSRSPGAILTCLLKQRMDLPLAPLIWIAGEPQGLHKEHVCKPGAEGQRPVRSLTLKMFNPPLKMGS